ncbi:hypothetical protein [Arcobacter sp. FWKO B]|uniref:hypothetical protein n=1 Tax=Arcobacter sp. FWKO B TaxID=2593672 RepID=UPI0018A3565B|nr:hypothetical protein [Arcobacter sp. FWKO B]QOG13093.1 hypothetical protein FWKOB_10520 [Arcobacter sp. FWKO B]
MEMILFIIIIMTSITAILLVLAYLDELNKQKGKLRFDDILTTVKKNNITKNNLSLEYSTFNKQFDTIAS